MSVLTPTQHTALLNSVFLNRYAILVVYPHAVTFRLVTFERPVWISVICSPFSSVTLFSFSKSHFLSLGLTVFSTYFFFCVSKPFCSSLSSGGTPFGTMGARVPQASLESDRSLQTFCPRPGRTPLY